MTAITWKFMTKRRIKVKNLHGDLPLNPYSMEIWYKILDKQDITFKLPKFNYMNQQGYLFCNENDSQSLSFNALIF